MSTCNVCFGGEIRKIFTRYQFLSGIHRVKTIHESTLKVHHEIHLECSEHGKNENLPLKQNIRTDLTSGILLGVVSLKIKQFYVNVVNGKKTCFTVKQFTRRKNCHFMLAVVSLTLYSIILFSHIRYVVKTSKCMQLSPKSWQESFLQWQILGRV